MSDSPFDEAGPLDGVVGSLEDVKEAPPIGKGVLQVFVSGEAVPGSRAMGLTTDLELLVHEFVDQRPGSIRPEKTRVPETPRAGEDEDIGIVLHGLELEPDAEAELRRLLRARVREHLASVRSGQ
jgi:hypothetical protein